MDSFCDKLLLKSNEIIVNTFLYTVAYNQQALINFYIKKLFVIYNMYQGINKKISNGSKNHNIFVMV